MNRAMGHGTLAMDTVTQAPAWSGKKKGVRTDSCLGAATEEAGG